MNMRHLAMLAAAFVATGSFTAHAQSLRVHSVQGQELDPAKRVPPPPTQAAPAQAPATAPTQPIYHDAQPVEPQPVVHAPAAGQPVAEPPASTYVDSHREGRGGAFVGAQYGRGMVYDDIDQDAMLVNAGYRWQAGPVSLLGLEAAAGRLDETREDGEPYDEVDFASLGFNGRFNFGVDSPMFGLVRAGYWQADSEGTDVDGGYFGLGLGVDVNRHFNVSVTYTNYVYFDDYAEDIYDANRADTLMLGVEARF